MAKKTTKAKRPKARRKRERDVPAPDPSKSRPEQMRHLRDKGWTYERIAARYNLTRQRVWQIINRGQPAEERPPRERPKTLLHGRTAERKLEQASNPKTVGDRIVYRRIKMEMTIGDLSDHSGIPYGVLSNYENNTSKPSFESLKKLSTSLKVSAHWLIFGVPFKKSRA